jgi:hypothetical protein
MYQKTVILAVMASIMLSAALLATPSFRVANAQGNTTATAGIADVDKLIQTVKSNHPALATFEEAKDVKDVVDKIKATTDVKEAVKTLAALHALQALREYKDAQEAQ